MRSAIHQRAISTEMRRNENGATTIPAQRGGPLSDGLRTLSIASVIAIAIALSLIFFYAPTEATEGFLQKIFYLHVPLAIVCLCGFVIGGLLAIQHLRTMDPRWDLRSYVAIHMSLIFGVGVLVTGSIWAKGSWGHWWVWYSPTLVSFLIIFLLYATYQPLRFSIDDPERQSRYASVFAIAAGAFVPVAYAAVQMSTSYLHPRVIGPTYAHLPASMALTFLVSLLAFALLFTTLCKFEITSKRTRGQARALRRLLAGEGEGGKAQGRSAAPTLQHEPAAGVGISASAEREQRGAGERQTIDAAAALSTGGRR